MQSELEAQRALNLELLSDESRYLARKEEWDRLNAPEERLRRLEAERAQDFQQRRAYQEQAQRLLEPTFLVHNPIVVSLHQAEESDKNGPNTPAKGDSAINLGTNDLIIRIIRDNSPTLISRLVAADFEVLKKAQGLDADQFRILLERIRPRAISDAWARLAFLDIVRAPHTEAVNVRVRTAALGALVNDARRLGKLTQALEKEVFAASAEVPHLSHLALTPGDDEHVEDGPAISA